MILQSILLTTRQQSAHAAWFGRPILVCALVVVSGCSLSHRPFPFLDDAATVIASPKTTKNVNDKNTTAVSEARPPTPRHTPALFQPPAVVLANLPKAPIEPDGVGPEVVALQEFLSATGFYRGKLDGYYGSRTRSAVTALHKALDMPRTASWRGDEWRVLQYYSGPVLPARVEQANRLEIDLDRQLLYLIKQNRLEAIIPISTGNGESYVDSWGHKVTARTPEGSFTLYRRHRGWRESYLGRMYWPWYFSGGYALHGSFSVPPEPASHGCVRIPLWDADYLNRRLAIGMPVHLWRQHGQSAPVRTTMRLPATLVGE